MTDFSAKKNRNGAKSIAMRKADRTPLRRKVFTRKRLVATESRRECACKRTGEPSVTFCEKGGTVERVTDFFIK